MAMHSHSHSAALGTEGRRAPRVALPKWGRSPQDGDGAIDTVVAMGDLRQVSGPTTDIAL
jgi:hypothetical protein